MHALFKHDLHISNCLPTDLHGNKVSKHHNQVSSPFLGTISLFSPPLTLISLINSKSDIEKKKVMPSSIFNNA